MSKTFDIQTNNQALADLIATINALPTSPLIEHAYRHAIDGGDTISPASIGAVPAPIQFPLEQPDLNTVLDTGYYVPAAAAFCTTALNFPLEGVSGILQVSTAYTTTYQIFLTTTNRLFVRGYIASQWNSWVEIYSTLNKPTPAQIGAVATSSLGQANGIATLGADGYIPASQLSPDVGSVKSVNGKTGAVTLTAADVNAVPTTRTINSKALSANITLTAADVNAVPTTRTINNKALSANISLTAADVGALATTGGTVSGQTTFTGNVTFKPAESVTSGTTAGTRNALYIYGQTYGNDAACLKTAGKFSYGDPGPQIIFGSNNNASSSQKAALIYTDHDAISSGTSLSLVSTETNCHFIAPSVKGAVWNDYAEFRSQISPIEPGYCVFSNDAGQVSKTTKKLQACDGIVSDTFGFSIGETDECKTPLAVAGRVLAYCDGDRKNYHAGDTVCAGLDGKVVKMTREEIKEYPDRIIGIVSEIPEYETWGTGNVQVNGRIWIKVK